MPIMTNTLILTETWAQADEINESNGVSSRFPGIFPETFAKPYLTQILGIRADRVILRKVPQSMRNTKYDMHVAEIVLNSKGGSRHGEAIHV